MKGSRYERVSQKRYFGVMPCSALPCVLEES